MIDGTSRVDIIIDNSVAVDNLQNDQMIDLISIASGADILRRGALRGETDRATDPLRPMSAPYYPARAGACIRHFPRCSPSSCRVQTPTPKPVWRAVFSRVSVAPSRGRLREKNTGGSPVPQKLMSSFVRLPGLV